MFGDIPPPGLLGFIILAVVTIGFFIIITWYELFRAVQDRRRRDEEIRREFLAKLGRRKREAEKKKRKSAHVQ